MVRMVVHAGFHKTGTSTIQKILRQNKRLLQPFTRIVLKPGLASLCDATRLWSRRRETFERRGVEIELELFFEALNPKAGRTICISAEDLAGHMPGRKSVERYDAAPGLMQLFAQAAANAPFQVNDLTFLFTTRSSDSWLRSSYVQHVRGDRMVMDFEAYAEQFKPAGYFETILDDISKAVAPASVVQSRLEDTRNLPFGPAAPLLDLLNVPEEIRSQMTPSSPVNPAPADDVLAELLRLNRSGLGDAEVRQAKFDLLQG
jgi:hypothetical protein